MEVNREISPGEKQQQQQQLEEPPKPSYFSRWGSKGQNSNQNQGQGQGQPSLFLSSMKAQVGSIVERSDRGHPARGRGSIYHGYSTGMITSQNPKYAGGTSVESDFSDHFKIRTQNDGETSEERASDLEKCPDQDLGSGSDSDDQSATDHRQEIKVDVAGDQHQQGDLARKDTKSAEVGEVKSVPTKTKLLTPFQFVKRQKPGISSIIDTKSMGVKSTGIGGSRFNRVFSNVRNSGEIDATSTPIPIPGRAQICEPRVSVLRPFTAAPNLTLTQPEPSRKSLLENNDLSAIDFPREDIDDDLDLNANDFNKTLETNVESNVEHESTLELDKQSQEKLSEVKPGRISIGSSQIPVPVSSPAPTARRLPMGYFSKQLTPTSTSASNPNSRHLGSSAGFGREQKNQGQFKGQGQGHGQSQSLLSQQKANVYRNQGYTPSTYIPLVPAPIWYSTSASGSTAATAPSSAAPSYQQQYYARLLAIQTPNPNPTPAARGDAPGEHEKVLGSAHAQGHNNPCSESDPKNDVDNLQGQTSSTYLERMRPQTVCEGQASHLEKLGMNSTVKPAPASTSIGIFAQKPGQPGTALEPHKNTSTHRNYQPLANFCHPFQNHGRPGGNFAQGQFQGHGQGSQQLTGYSPHAPSSSPGHKSIMSAKYFRNELTSPLGNFYMPIRPFITLPSDKGRDAPESDPESSLNFEMGYLTLNEVQTPQKLQGPGQGQGHVTNYSHSIFRTCSQKLPIPIQLVFDCLVNIRKVGEGVYGEVFSSYFKGLPDQRVYKVVPIEGSKIVNGEKQKKFGEVEPEIIISQELNKLRGDQNGCYTDGMSKLLFTRICQGKYPTILVDQWKSWHRSYVSQNDVPEFDSSQLYVIFEFDYHGTDIESYKFKNARQSMAVLLHVIHALAVAEAGFEFEHRDLHWGNILVQKTREPLTTYTIFGSTFRVPNCGLKSTIIDFTISRLTNSAGRPIFTDLANDEDQFCGSEDYQFEIYRLMRAENKNDWSTFCPKTNIFWAHYLVEKLIEKGRYLDNSSPTHNLFRNKLFRIQNSLLKFSSCIDCVRRFLPPFCRDLELEAF